MQKNYIRAFAPATIANVACGFDVLGMAIDFPGDEIILRKNDSGKITIENIFGDNGELPRDPQQNAATVVIRDFLAQQNSNIGIAVEIYKNMPSGSGLGSSAASAVVAGFAINALFDNPLTKEDLLPLCINGEEAACGARIADNVAASLYGGLVMINSYSPLTVNKINVPENLFITVIHPHITILTKEARAILPAEFPIKDIVKQQGALAAFIAGIYESDKQKIAIGLNDFLIEPYRKKLIPHFDALKNTALENGALGCSISGSGPSVFALADSEATARKIQTAFDECYASTGYQYKIYCSKVNQQGPKVIELH